MNISRFEQRVLHALARGARIVLERDDDRRRSILSVTCITREGWILSDCDHAVFCRLRSKRLIASRNSGPYTISRRGLAAVRAQADNR